MPCPSCLISGFCYSSIFISSLLLNLPLSPSLFSSSLSTISIFMSFLFYIFLFSFSLFPTLWTPSCSFISFFSSLLSVELVCPAIVALLLLFCYFFLSTLLFFSVLASYANSSDSSFSFICFSSCIIGLRLSFFFLRFILLYSYDSSISFIFLFFSFVSYLPPSPFFSLCSPLSRSLLCMSFFALIFLVLDLIHIQIPFHSSTAVVHQPTSKCILSLLRLFFFFSKRNKTAQGQIDKAEKQARYSLLLQRLSQMKSQFRLQKCLEEKKRGKGGLKD